MPTTVNLTGNIADLIGTDFDPRRTKVWVTTNLPDDVLIDATGNEVRLGDAYATVATDGTFTFTGLWATNAATNPTAFQYQLHIDYPKRSSSNGRKTWDSGWFDLTTTSNIADVVQGQYVPPTWMTTATATLQGYVDDAETARDAAVDISNIDTSDAVVEALVRNTGGAGPLTSGALNTKYPGATVVVGTGIDPTGATDSTTAIQAEITAAGVGGTLHFPLGTFIASGLAPLSGQTWTGKGTLKRPNASTASIIFGATATPDFRLVGLTIDGNRANSTATASAAVRLTSSSRCIIEGVTFKNTPSSNPALELRGGSDSIVTRNTFTDVGYGIIVGLEAGSTDSCDRNVISANTFTRIDLNAIFATSSVGSTDPGALTMTGTVVTGNAITGARDAAIEMGVGCRRSVVTSNTIDGDTSVVNGNRTGILIRDNIDAVVAGNVVNGYSDATAKGIALAGFFRAGGSDRVVVEGNTVSNLNGVGIFCNAVTSLTVANNIVADCAEQGMVLIGAEITTSDNTVARNGIAGIQLGESGTPGVDRGSVVGNACYDNTGPGVLVFAGNATYLTRHLYIDGNRAYDTRTAGARTQTYGLRLFGGTLIQLGKNHLYNNATADYQNFGATIVTRNQALTLIAEITVGTATANIDFTAIPNTYRDLVIEAKIRSDRAANLNDNVVVTAGTGGVLDAGATSYRSHMITYTNVTGAVDLNSTGRANFFAANLACPAAQADPDVWGDFRMRILDYADATYWRAIEAEASSHSTNAAMYRDQASGHWKNKTGAIDTLRIAAASGGQFIAGTTVRLYGRA